MFGGSSKIGRGGGRGGGVPRNRKSFPPPPNRNPASAGKVSLGGGASGGPNKRATVGGPGPGSGSVSARAVEENFSLIPGRNPLTYAMIIRLAPDLVEEIKKLEAQGKTARIKFDSVSNNSSGNVIDVGGKEFKFTWSQEFGDLCDIYEERQSGEDGNGLLVESGCAWRKLNVQRILDESTKNHVKMRSEEAERKFKSRRAIVIDPGNSMKKQLAMAEANPWKMLYRKREPPFKKRKVDSPLVMSGGPSKPALKAGLAPAVTGKARSTTSPAPSTPEQHNAPISPVGTGNLLTNQISNEDTTVLKEKGKKKESTVNSEKSVLAKTNFPVGDTRPGRTNAVIEGNDLQSMLVNLLKEAPMSLKALEKAVGDSFPNSAKKIEPILRKVATFQAPGRYFLKPQLEADCKKLVSENGSSPEHFNQQLHDSVTKHDQASIGGPIIPETTSVGELDLQTKAIVKPVEQLDGLDKADSENHSTDVFGGKRAAEKTEGQAGSSSDSGSDSDSDSDSDSSHSGSDSDSHSRSQSRSRSDSDSEASSNSKEGSDEDVDIMTSEDDKEPKQKLQSELNQDENKEDVNGSDVDIDGDGSEDVDIDGGVNIDNHRPCATMNALPGDEHGVELDLVADLNMNQESEKPSDAINCISSSQDELERQTFIGQLFDDSDNIKKDNMMHEQTEISVKQHEIRSKRGPDLLQLDQKSGPSKRLKGEKFHVPLNSQGKALSSIEVENELPFKSFPDPVKCSAGETLNPSHRDQDDVFEQYRGLKPTFSEFQESDRKPSDHNVGPKGTHHALLNKSKKSGNVCKPLDKTAGPHEAFHGEKESVKNVQRDGGSIKGRKIPSHQYGSTGAKASISSDSYSRKSSEGRGKYKDAGKPSSLNLGSSPMENDRLSSDRNHLDGQTSSLQREHSDLWELGEFREPEEPGVKKNFEKSNSFKNLDNNNSTVLGNNNSDLAKGRNIWKSPNSVKASPTNSMAWKRGMVEHNTEDATRSQSRPMQSQLQSQSREDHGETGNLQSRSGEASNKRGKVPNGTRVGVVSEGHGENQKKAPAAETQQHGAKRESNTVSSKETKARVFNGKANSINGRKTTGMNDDKKRREIFLGEDDSSYLKYERDEPKLKEPIKDFSQYKEYVQEYCDKYKSYSSLNRILENCRNEFQKLGEDLASAKGKDVERYKRISEQLRELYRECGPRHKRLKKIFLVLHEELKHLKQMMKDFACSHSKGP